MFTNFAQNLLMSVRLNNAFIDQNWQAKLFKLNAILLTDYWKIFALSSFRLLRSYIYFYHILVSDIPLSQPVEEEDNNFTSFKKKDEPKSLDNIKSKFYVATEVVIGIYWYLHYRLEMRKITTFFLSKVPEKKTKFDPCVILKIAKKRSKSGFFSGASDRKNDVILTYSFQESSCKNSLWNLTAFQMSRLALLAVEEIFTSAYNLTWLL